MRLGPTARRFAPAALLLMAACTTTTVPIQTPGGSTELFRGRYVILGVANRVSSTRIGDISPAPDDQRGREAEMNPTEYVPVPTRAIVPAVTGWAIGYGDSTTLGLDSARPREPNEQAIEWRRANAYFGMAQADVAVIRISPDIVPNDLGEPTRTASLRITLRLSDWWQNQRWWGEVRYQLIFLGCADGTMTC